MAGPETRLRERPYHAENTCTRPITDVKQHRARLVVSWETRCEARVSFSFFVCFFFALRSDVFIYFYYGGVHEECVNSRRLASWALLQALCYAGHRREMPDMIGMMSESLRSPLVGTPVASGIIVFRLVQPKYYYYQKQSRADNKDSGRCAAGGLSLTNRLLTARLFSLLIAR